MLSAPPLVHIGYHKTATTWFQQRCYPSVADACRAGEPGLPLDRCDCSWLWSDGDTGAPRSGHST